MSKTGLYVLMALGLFSAPIGMIRVDNDGFIPLFSSDRIPKGWLVREWNDVAKSAAGAEWTVKDGVLHTGKRRGTWLMSEKEYSDFILEFEIKLTERGNSGVALRAPLKGDPAFDGMELQIADLRYNTQAKDSELTGGIYRAIAPTKQVYKPTSGTSVPWGLVLAIISG